MLGITSPACQQLTGRPRVPAPLLHQNLHLRLLASMRASLTYVPLTAPRSASSS